MKRSAAIVGDTPQFIAWSIRQTCDLKRDINSVDPQQVETALRAVRLASLGLLEDRIIENDLVYQLETGNKIPLVFSLREIAETFGGWGQVEACCKACPANANPAHKREDGAVAGCFGWLAIDDCRFLSSLEQSSAVRTIVEPAELIATDPLWNGLWVGDSLSTRQLAAVLELFELAESSLGGSIQVDHFVAALRICKSHRLELDVAAFPAGHSDGLTWTINAHCPVCRATQNQGSDCCRVCRRAGSAHPPIKRKVRGHRPFAPVDQRYEKSEADRLQKLINAKAKPLEQNQD